MNEIIITALDVITTITFGVALMFALQIPRTIMDKPSRMLLAICMGIYVFVGISNVLQHGQITDYFDRYEDYTEILFIPFFLFFIYSIILRQETNRYKQAEQALREAFDKVRELGHIINFSPAVAFLWRAEEGWPVEYVSENVDQFGYNTDDFISERVSYAQVVYNEDLQGVAEEVKNYSEEGVPEFSQEYRIVTRDGQVRWVDDRTWIRRNEDGQITHYQGIILDITETKGTAEKALQFGNILEKSINEIYIFDINSLEFIHANQGAIENLGYSMKELRHLTPLEIKPEFTLESFNTMIEPLHNGKKNKIEFITYHRRKDSTQYPVEVHLQVSEFESRKVFLSIILDITERKQVEYKLQQNLKEITALNTLGQQVSASLSLDQVVKSAIDGIINATHPDMAVLFLREDNRLILQGVSPKSSKYTHEETPVDRVGECLCGLAVAEGKPIYSVNIHNDPRCTWNECKKAGFHSFVALPLRSANKIIGVLGAASGTERDFGEQASFLETLSNQISIGLQNALLHEQLERHAIRLEERVSERTGALEKKTRDLERFNKLFVDRELRMVELKKEIRRLGEKA